MIALNKKWLSGLVAGALMAVSAGSPKNAISAVPIMQKHLRELMSVAAAGKRAVLLFAVLHSAIERFSPARHIDPKYAQLLNEAQKQGVEILAYKAELSADNMTLKSTLPVVL